MVWLVDCADVAAARGLSADMATAAFSDALEDE